MLFGVYVIYCALSFAFACFCCFLSLNDQRSLPILVPCRIALQRSLFFVLFLRLLQLLFPNLICTSTGQFIFCIRSANPPHTKCTQVLQEYRDMSFKTYPSTLMSATLHNA